MGKKRKGRSESELVDIEATLLHETDAAYRIDDGKVKVWIPKSQCEESEGVFTMPEWLAREKGLT